MSNTFIFSVLIIVVLILFGSMIAGDVFIKFIAFNSKNLQCSSIVPITTSIETTIPISTKLPYSLPITTQQIILNTLNTCIDISKDEINFAQFRVIVNWMTFIILTLMLFFSIKDYRKYNLYSSIFIITLSFLLWLIVFTGGIIMSMFVFNASLNTCNNKDYYCYELSYGSLLFAKMYSVLSFFITFIINIGIIYYIALNL